MPRLRLLVLACTLVLLTLGVLLTVLPWASDAAAAAPGPEKDRAAYRRAATLRLARRANPTLASLAVSTPAPRVVNERFELLGHHDLGLEDTNGDVWVHGDFAYIGTWADPCNARGVKIIDISDLRAPRLIGTLASRMGTSAEDVVVRHVSTPSFTGDLLAVGIQRCDFENPDLDAQQFGAEFWDVTDPYHPVKLSELGTSSFGGRA